MADDWAFVHGFSPFVHDRLPDNATDKSRAAAGKALPRMAEPRTGAGVRRWIHMMEDTENATIYIPTEAGLPILEAGKRPTKTP